MSLRGASLSTFSEDNLTGPIDVLSHDCTIFSNEVKDEDFRLAMVRSADASLVALVEESEEEPTYTLAMFS